VRVCIIYHDTGVPNSAQCTALHAVADLFIIHEPAEDLPGAIYLRQGVPAAPGGHQPYFPSVLKFRAYHGQPTVGSLGFPFPWKNYDLLAEASFLAGWALILLAPNATPEQIAGWRSRNPHSFIESGFTERREAVATLAACDATAFLYANANTGTSAAIRQGIAARKPVIATSAGGCRQFRDLYLDPVGREAIMWMSSLTVEGVAANLMAVTPAPFDAPTVRLAHQDRWALRGQQIAALLRGTGWETLR
jgi:hypothetical protein